jgi:phosphoglycolate phosphatase-like HAD superfamily hydrolase
MDNIKNVKDVITVGKYCKDILSAISNLNKFNITVPDTHVLNIGRDDNYNFYLFDLGASSVKHTPRTRKVISENIEKKLIIFDFDGTLVNTDAKIYIIHSDGEKIGISPEEFNDYVPREGDTFDYYDFADIDYLINPQEIKSAMKIFMAIEKVKEPNKKIAILTARRNSKPVVNYLNRKGFKNYTVVSVGGDISTDVANKKKIWIERQIKNGYNTVVYFDDSAENIKAVKELKNKYPDVKFELKHVVEWKKR